jgi:hypothetical protein
VLHQYIEQQERPAQSTLGTDGPPAWTVNAALKGGALAHISVASIAACGIRISRSS